MARLKLWLGRLALLGFLALAVVIGWGLAQREPPDAEAFKAAPPVQAPPAPSPVSHRPLTAGDCERPAYGAAAIANATEIDTLPWAPLRGRAETGWRVYGPRIGEEIHSDCAFESEGFAEALARWQSEHGLTADGRMAPETFQRMRTGWDLARPFQRAARNGCPAAPAPASLSPADKGELYGGKAALVEPRALAAYRRLVADARAAGVADDPTLLTIFSAFRDPAADAARCAQDGDCGGAARAVCSAHRTGAALDLNLGHAPGSRPDSTDDANRVWMSQTPTYRWLVRNAGRYGFVNYAFEPWHWEWAGGG